MKKYVLYMGWVLALTMMVTGAYAQKVDQRLTRLVEQSGRRLVQGQRPVKPQAVKRQIAVFFNADGTVSSMSAIATLKEGATCPTERLEKMGIQVRYVIGDMVALFIPADKLHLLEDVEEFSFVRADEYCHIMNDEARKATGVDKINTAAAATAEGLPQAYTGKGIVLGIIDRGIDFNHAAFRNADGTTRIKKAFMTSDDGKTLNEYTTEEQIKALTTDYTLTSHGTHTSNTAGGSDLGNGRQGMAPEAELVLVGLGTNTYNSYIAQCIQRIFEYADQVGKPAVVSISIGATLGLHDGSNDVAKAVGFLTENGTKPGRSVVISSGNSAAKWQSIVKTLHAADADADGWQLKTVLGAATYPSTTSPKVNVSYDSTSYLYADDHKDFVVELKLVDLLTGNFEPFDGHLFHSDGKPYTPTIIKDSSVPTLKGEKATVQTLDFSEDTLFLDAPNYRLVLLVKAGHDGQTIKMINDGDGNGEPCFDAPVEEGQIFNFKNAGYTKGNSDFACSSYICNNAVISVGSYVTRNAWLNYEGKDYHYLESEVTGKIQQPGEISDFSSYCIDDNGGARPTLIAPGHALVSAANSYDINFFNQQGEPSNADSPYKIMPYVEKFGRKNWFSLERGTSMAAPVASGIITLWLQAKPEMTTNEILEVLKATCVNDDFTTNPAMIPSGNKTQAGFGKIDCLAGLKMILKSTGIETISADGHREATPSTMYSVDAPVYNMMGQRIDKSTKGLVIYKGHKYLNK